MRRHTRTDNCYFRKVDDWMSAPLILYLSMNSESFN